MGHLFDHYAQLSAWGLEMNTEKRPENNWEEYFEQFFSRRASKWMNPQCLPKNFIGFKYFLYYALDLKQQEFIFKMKTFSISL